jgi:hypothetical protein
VRDARLRRAWINDGAIYQELGAYGDMLSGYASPPTAGAAADGLMEIVTLLEQQSMVCTALVALRTVEHGVSEVTGSDGD